VQQEDNPPKLDSWLSGYPTAVLADKGTFLLVGLLLGLGLGLSLLLSGICMQPGKGSSWMCMPVWQCQDPVQ
jgi:hypothetical protein